jgi:hypothetical protein
MGPQFFKKNDPKNDNSDSPVEINEETKPKESDWKGKGGKSEGGKGEGGKK